MTTLISVLLCVHKHSLLPFLIKLLLQSVLLSADEGQRPCNYLSCCCLSVLLLMLLFVIFVTNVVAAFYVVVGALSDVTRR